MTENSAGEGLRIDYGIAATPSADLISQAAHMYVHRNDDTTAFLPLMGERFVEEFIAQITRRRAAFLVTAMDGQKLRGFILFAEDTGQMISATLRAPHRFAWPAICAIARRPRIVRDIIDTLSYGRKTKGDVRPELVVFDVEPSTRSRGVGRNLIATLGKELASRGIRRYKVTVHRSNTGACRFYEANGFQLARTFVLYRIPWHLYVREVRPA